MFDQRQILGNIRSVNVDYLNNSYSNNKKFTTQHDEDYNHFKVDHLRHLNAQKHCENKQTSKIYQDRLSRLQKSTISDKNYTLESLEAAILDSVAELKQFESNSPPVNVRILVEHLASSKYANLVNYNLLKDCNSIDYAIKSLVKSGRLCLSDTIRGGESLTEQSSHEAQPQQQSVFLEQLIALPADDKQTMLHQHQNQHHNLSSRDSTSSGNSSRISTSNETENYNREQLPGEHRSRLCSSTNTSTTTKSKSTTLDSGIQSWDQMLSCTSPVNCEDLATTKIMYSTSFVRADQLAEQQRQVLEQDISSLTDYNKSTTINGGGGSSSRSSNNNNRSDTIEALKQPNQQQQQRISRRREQVENKPVRKRGFSLGRSFSFRNKKIPTLEVEQNDHQQLQRSEKTSDDHQWSAAMQQNDIKQNEFSVKETAKRSQNLPSLFRSKSMRLIPTSRISNQVKIRQQQQQKSNLDDESAYQLRTSKTTQDYTPQRQATIDYLAGAQHKRSFSIRRNSLLNFNPKDSNESSGGKIVLFLRKLFSIKRSRQQQHEDENYMQSNITRASCRTSSVEGRRATNNGYKLEDNLYSRNRFSSRRSNEKVSSQTQTQDNTNHMIIAETLRSSNSSSASSSLIEILDCSKIAKNSKRPFKEAPASNLIELNNNKQRATTCWTSLHRPPTIRRSDSSLSHNSEASCSTTKSTVSQQLRRHLDEAYKRHRNCSSQQEREFIDSINVLRQASRHALPPKLSSSRSSSKNRYQTTNKSMTSSGAKSASTLNDDTSIGSSSYSATNRLCNYSKANEETNNRSASCNCYKQHDEQALDGGSGVNTTAANYNHRIHRENNNNNFAQQELDLRLKSSSAITNEEEKLIQINKLDLKQKPLNLDYEFASSPLNDNLEGAAARLGNCCVCDSYLNSAARLCPLTCFPPPPSTACFLNPNLNQQHVKPSDLHQAQKLLPSGEAEASNGVDFCCPLWQSMLYNYCPPFYLTNSGQPYTDQTALQLSQGPLMAAEQHNRQQQPQEVPSQQQPHLSRLENFSSQHQLQQHQHNTTIDLKIEIAPAEFGKMKKKRKEGRVRSRVEDEQPNDDSLESSRSCSSQSAPVSASASASASASNSDESVVCELEADQGEVVKEEESPMSSLLHNGDDYNHDQRSRRPVESEFEHDSCESDSANNYSAGSKSDSLELTQQERTKRKTKKQQHTADRLFRQASHLEAEK